MDAYGQIGPEKGDYQDDVAVVARCLEEGRTVTFALTHRLTRQQVTVALKDDMVICGEGRGGGPPGTRGGGVWAFVAVDEHGAYWFRIDLLADAGYVASKLEINVADAGTLVEFLALLASALGHGPQRAVSSVTEIRR